LASDQVVEQTGIPFVMRLNEIVACKLFHVPGCMSVSMFRDSADDANHESKYGEAIVILHVVRVICT
jgi:hypothetical protein